MRLLLLATTAMALIGFSGKAMAMDTACLDLKGKVVGDAAVLTSEAVENRFIAPGGQAFETGAFCRIVARATPSPQSNIVMEIWLPDAQRWNGKFLGTGNGGFAGDIRYAGLAGGLRRGYAVANTDMGSYPAAAAGVGYEAGNERPEVVRDWAYRATHEMTLVSKAMVSRYYGRRPDYSLFAGCSTGGHQGLMEAQRYPEDYDAILAGAPGHNRTHLHAAFTHLALATRQSGGDIVSPAKLGLFSAAALRACVGKDGGAPGDSFLTDPTKCGFRPQDLACRPDQVSAECLTAGEIKTLQWTLDGIRNPRTGELIYPGLTLGSEGILAFLAGGLPNGRLPAELARWVFGPDWDPSTFSFDADMTRVDNELAPIVNAMDADLSRFVARGGKLILYHGWSDFVVRPIDSVLYYDRLTAAGADQTEFARLFMAPGVSHCQDGLGPDNFGQSAEAVTEGGPDTDLLAALDQWVTTGVAPEQVMATRFDQPRSPERKVIATRPICAYPKVARYNGHGDAAQADSFDCSAAEPARYEPPAQAYLR
ncbi:MAG: tannase/feruloyl esterase family alpha/beta hydrolase [Candidatus Brevundimonas colombiensis]|uniref:Tannase/feruloyl esterase family alpha/beta hydrolase n=1 Tax=Candidatus Brevundimonas colombiensis TaxID=3121376 RepID=A0AAJ5X2J8_9CAUL|nr:tannase/feruloyl esterase family alpha/beta hydrolase [Brevundimonas sp.]WEK41461.1 MAG: tannase/feruloyl esterase family alpha/beta hydrolase [Brevundimonas sp.]